MCGVRDVIAVEGNALRAEDLNALIVTVDSAAAVIDRSNRTGFELERNDSRVDITGLADFRINEHRTLCIDFLNLIASEETSHIEIVDHHIVEDTAGNFDVIDGRRLRIAGADADEMRLTDLVEQVCRAVPEVRIRLGSLEPRTVTEDFCRRASQLPNLCPHFHLSLQSGCDATLRRMNRRYDTARFRESVRLLRAYFPRPAITTDVICGFPQETEEEFSATLAFLEECRFAAMHVFPYSIRPGTKAADMPQVPGPVKEERAVRAGALAARLHRAYLEECVGRTYPVLFEQPVAGRYGGHAPNYMEVAVSGGEDLHNRVLPVRITGTDGEILWGELE